MQKITFYPDPENGFYHTLKAKVNRYFREKELTRFATPRGVAKLAFLVTLYVATYLLIISGTVSGWPLLAIAYGFGLLAMVTAANVVHDAVHGTFSPNRRVNGFLIFLVDLFGGNGYIWGKTHVHSHHYFTNVPYMDVDLVQTGIVRIIPSAPYRWYHRYQHLYMPFLYLFFTVFWLFVRDFKYFTLKRIGNRRIQHPVREYVILAMTKVFYLLYILVVPYFLLDLAWWQLLMGFTVMHFGSATIAMLMLLSSHIQEGSEFPEPDQNGLVRESWAVHEFNSTYDFCPNNRLITFLTSGINNHIAHHLFPNVSHVHLPAITKMMVETAEEFGLEYKTSSLLGQLRSHFVLLKRQGRPPEAAALAA